MRRRHQRPELSTRKQCLRSGFRGRFGRCKEQRPVSSSADGTTKRAPEARMPAFGSLSGRALLLAKDDHPVGEIVGRKRHGHPVTENHADTELAHPSAKLSANLRARFGLHLKLATSVNVADHALQLDVVVPLLLRGFPKRIPVLPPLARAATGATASPSSQTEPSPLPEGKQAIGRTDLIPKQRNATGSNQRRLLSRLWQRVRQKLPDGAPTNGHSLHLLGPPCVPVSVRTIGRAPH